MLATRFRGLRILLQYQCPWGSSVGIDIGAYIYSHATSVEMAEQEADFILNVIKDYPISYPVVFGRGGCQHTRHFVTFRGQCGD